MAELTIRLIPDPDTGKKNIVISLKSDEDAMPHEHEQQHRALVEKALGRKLEDAEEIVIERESAEEPAAPATNTPPAERRKQGQGR